MRRAFAALLVALGVAAGLAFPAHAEKRVALVVGNSVYQNSSKLANPANDAEDVSVALKGLGFEVIEGRDLTHSDMLATVRRFGQALRGADTALFFYAGHGMDVAGANYLVPVDAKLTDEQDLAFEAVNLNLVMQQMERNAATAIVFLDACRDNPMARSLASAMGTRSAAVGRGLARVESGSVGSFIAFATQPGNVALDGDGRNSPFSGALVKHLGAPGKSLSDVMIAVRNEVRAATQNKQVPWEHSSLTGQFYFAPQPVAVVQPAPAQPTDDIKSIMAELQSLKRQLAEQAEQKLKAGVPSTSLSPAVPIESEAPKADGPPAAPPAEQQVAALPIAPSPAGESTGAQRDCDRLIGEPVDRVVYGGRMDSITAFKDKIGEALAACETAARERPDERFDLLLGIAHVFSDSPDKAGPVFRRAAERGDARAAAALGFLMLDRGPDVAEANKDDTPLLLLRAAYRGSPEAMLVLGAALKDGKVATKDVEEGIRWVVRSAEAGLAWSMLVIGTERDFEDKVPDALGWLKRAAESGHAAAMAALGDAYQRGKGIPEDFTEAQRWLRKATAAGFAPGKEQLASLEAAHAELAKTSDADIAPTPAALTRAPAQPLSGQSFAAEDCDRLVREPVDRMVYGGIMQSPDKLRPRMPLGIAACEIAAENDPAEARFKLQLGLGYALADQDDKAKLVLQALAEQGNPLAMTALGAMLSRGASSLPDPEQSVAWLRKAADLGQPEAMVLLGAAYNKRGGIAVDDAEAMRWLMKAAEAGFGWAMVLLGSNAPGIPTDERMGWMRKAAGAGNAHAMMLLGERLRDGTGIERNFGESETWLRKAEAAGHPDAKAALESLARAMAPPAPVQIAVAGPITGNNAHLGKEMKDGVEMAVADINAAGGVLGRPLVLEIADDACDPAQAAQVATRLADQGVVLVVGHLCSGSSIPAAHVYAVRGVVQITPGSTNPVLTDQRAGPTIFRLTGRDDRQGTLAAKVLAERFRRIAILHDGTTYGETLAKETKAALNGNGTKEVLFERYAPRQKDYSKLVTKLKRSKPDSVFIGGFHDDAGLILRQMRNQGVRAPMMGGDVLMTSEFWSIAGEAAEGALMTAAADLKTRPEAADAVARFRAKGIEPGSYTLGAYAAVQAWKQGAEKAGSVAAADVAKALGEAELDTVTGRVRFDAKGDQNLPSYDVYRWSRGTFAKAD